MSDEEKKTEKKPLNRRSFMSRVAGATVLAGGAAAVVTGEASAQNYTGHTDSDTGNGADRSGYGRTGNTDTDSGNGRGSIAGYGRGAQSATDADSGGLPAIQPGPRARQFRRSPIPTAAPMPIPSGRGRGGRTGMTDNRQRRQRRSNRARARYGRRNRYNGRRQRRRRRPRRLWPRHTQPAEPIATRPMASATGAGVRRCRSDRRRTAPAATGRTDSDRHRRQRSRCGT